MSIFGEKKDYVNLIQIIIPWKLIHPHIFQMKKLVKYLTTVRATCKQLKLD